MVLASAAIAAAPMPQSTAAGAAMIERGERSSAPAPRKMRRSWRRRSYKRSPVLLEQGEVGHWFRGTIEEARALIKLTPAEAFDAASADFLHKRQPFCCSNARSAR